MKKSFEILRGKNEEGTNLVVSSKWVELYDPDTFSFLLDRLREFESDLNNSTDAFDVEDFLNGKWFVEYSFNCQDNNSIKLDISAGDNAKKLANQPEWTTLCFTLKDATNDDFRIPIEDYARIISEQNNVEKNIVKKQLKENQMVDLLYILGEIDLSQFDDDEDLNLIMKVLLEDFGIETIIENGKLINLSTEPEVCFY